MAGSPGSPLSLLPAYTEDFLGGFLGGIGGFLGTLSGFFTRVTVRLGGVGNFFAGLVDLISPFWWIFVGGGGALGRLFISASLDLLGPVTYFSSRYPEQSSGKRKLFRFNGGSGLFLTTGGGAHVLLQCAVGADQSQELKSLTLPIFKLSTSYGMVSSHLEPGILRDSGAWGMGTSFGVCLVLGMSLAVSVICAYGFSELSV